MRSNNLPSFPTLFLADLAENVVGDRLALDRSEAEHLRVRRCRPGASVHITDGRGMRWSGELRALKWRGAEVTLRDPIPAVPALPVNLAVGIGNRARTLTLIEKAAEFGARGIQPLECERSQSVGDAGRSPAFWSKARSRAIAALKQSGGSWLPQIEAPEALDAYLIAMSDDSTEPRLLLDPGGVPLAERLSGWGGTERLTVLVGPEGGLTDEERERSGRGAPRRVLSRRAYPLSSRTLRFETAALAALAVVSQRALQGS